MKELEYTASEYTAGLPVAVSEIDALLERAGKPITKDPNKTVHFLNRVKLTIDSMQADLGHLRRRIDEVSLNKSRRGAPSTLSPLDALKFASPEEIEMIVGRISRAKMRQLRTMVEDNMAAAEELDRARARFVATIQAAWTAEKISQELYEILMEDLGSVPVVPHAHVLEPGYFTEDDMEDWEPSPRAPGRDRLVPLRSSMTSEEPQAPGFGPNEFGLSLEDGDFDEPDTEEAALPDSFLDIDDEEGGTELFEEESPSEVSFPDDDSFLAQLSKAAPSVKNPFADEAAPARPAPAPAPAPVSPPRPARAPNPFEDNGPADPAASDLGPSPAASAAFAPSPASPGAQETGEDFEDFEDSEFSPEELSAPALSSPRPVRAPNPFASDPDDGSDLFEAPDVTNKPARVEEEDALSFVPSPVFAVPTPAFAPGTDPFAPPDTSWAAAAATATPEPSSGLEEDLFAPDADDLFEGEGR